MRKNYKITLPDNRIQIIIAKKEDHRFACVQNRKKLAFLCIFNDESSLNNVAQTMIGNYKQILSRNSECGFSFCWALK